jgi:hypothetical protein
MNAVSTEKLLEEVRREKAENNWKTGLFSAAELQDMTFTPIAWIVADIIPAEGTILLCSKPKFGKSWFVLDLCLGCAADRFILGTIKPRQGDVLYLALEDSKRRLHRRMNKLLPFGSKWPERLTIKTDWRRLHEGGLDDIRAWHDDRKAKGGKPTVAVVDVLAKVRRPVGNRQLYEADYEALAGLTALANELGIAIVVVHHVRKLAADDLMEMVSGSFGVSGAVDTVLVMANNASGAVLDIRGRDVESNELAIEFDKATCRWRILGAASEIHLSQQQGKILAALNEAGKPLEIQEIALATGIKRASLDTVLLRIAHKGLIKRFRRGLYGLPDWPPPKGGKGQSDKSYKSDKPLDSVSDLETVEDPKENYESAKSYKSDCVSADSAGEAAEDISSVQDVSDLSDCQIYTQATDSACQFQERESDNNLTAPVRLSDSGNGHAPNDPGPMPAFLRRPPPELCDYCGGPGATGQWDWPDRPFGITLHSSCEGPWYDSERRQ